MSAIDRTHVRAVRILNRLAPAVAVPHGFYNPAGFEMATRALGRRSELYRDIFPRIYAKECSR